MNFFTLLFDQFNPSVLDIYGGPLHAPNLSKIAEQSAVFNNAICSYPVCTPCRTSLVTGLYAQKHERYHYHNGLSGKEQTLDKTLAENGYDCYYYGKWHMGHTIMPYYKEHIMEYKKFNSMLRDIYGDDDKVGIYAQYAGDMKFGGQLHIDEEFKKAVIESEKYFSKTKLGRDYGYILKYSGYIDCDMEWFMDYETTLYSINALKNRNINKPFALTCSIEFPHNPNFVPKKYYDMFNREDMTLPKTYYDFDPYFDEDFSRLILCNENEVIAKELLKIYYAQIMMIDDMVGMLLKTLEEENVLEDTLILITADHGDMSCEQRMFWKATKAMYNPIVKVPFIIRYPKAISPMYSSNVINTVDIMPTLLSFANLPIPNNIDGTDFKLYLTKKDMKKLPEYTFSQRTASYHEPNTTDMIYSEQFKYFSYANGTEFLFDIKNDFLETTNLAGNTDYCIVLEELKSKLYSWKDNLEESIYGSSQKIST